MKTPDIKINNIAIIQELLGKFPEKGNQVNFFSVGQIVEGAQPDFDLEAFLESLPEPRLRNLIEAAEKMAMKKFSTTIAASSWLGVSRRTLDRFHVSKGPRDTDEVKAIDIT